MYYEWIDISEGIDPVKSNSKEFMFCHYWFFNHGFKFRDSVCYGCHVFTMLCVSISSVVIITIKNFDYCCIVHNISKSEAIKLLKSAILENGGYIYKNTVLNCSLFKAGFSYFFV